MSESKLVRNRNGLRTVLVVGLLVAILVGYFAFVDGRCRVSFVNRTDRWIRQMTIEIVSEGTSDVQSSQTFCEIGPNGSVTTNMYFREDCGYRFCGEFANGQEFYGGGGYLTNGYSAPVTAELLENAEVVVSQD